MEKENYQINITSSAIKEINSQLKDNSIEYLRLGIKGGGCSGFSYVIKFDSSSIKENDLIFDIQNIKVVIDHKSIVYLNNCTLDWENTLLNQGFKFINPNVKSKCGCGHSFSVK